MHPPIRKCIVCDLPDEFNFGGEMCKCTPKQKEKHFEELEKSLNRQMFGGEPSITECKRVLQANGYIVKKNPKRKKPHRKLVQFKDY